MIVLVALAHREFECPKCLNQGPPFNIRGINCAILVILEFQEVVSFEIGCLESHLPVSNDIVTFFFLVEIP